MPTAGNWHQGLRLLWNRKFASRPNHIGYYVGCLGHGNLGDEIVYRGVRQIVGENVHLFAPPHAGSDGLSMLRRLRIEPSTVLLGGGTIVKKGPSAGYLARVMKILDAYPESKLVVFGPGVADPDFARASGSPTDTDAWRRVLNSAAYISVRGPLSKKWLQSWGVETPINISGDPAILFAADTFAHKKKERRLGFNLAYVAGRIYGRSSEQVIEFGASILRAVRAQGWTVTFIPFTPVDGAYMEQAAQRAGMTIPTEQMRTVTLAEAFSLIEQQDLVLCQRLHAGVVSSLVRTPCLLLEYESKARDFMMSIGREQWVQRTDELDTGRALCQLQQLYNEIDDHQAHLHEAILAARERLISEGNALKSVLSREA